MKINQISQNENKEDIICSQFPIILCTCKSFSYSTTSVVLESSPPSLKEGLAYVRPSYFFYFIQADRQNMLHSTKA